MPAMSSGRPMRFIGALGRDLRRRSSSSVAAIIFDSNGPGAIALTVILRREPLGEVAGELVHRGLGRRVRVRLEHRDLDPVDRADVDDPSRVVVGRRRLELRAQEPREVEHALHVEVEDPVPRGVVVVVERRAPRRARVVDEDVRPCPRGCRSRRPAAGTRPRSRGRPGCRCTRRARRAAARSRRTTSALRDET